MPTSSERGKEGKEKKKKRAWLGRYPGGCLGCIEGLGLREMLARNGGPSRNIPLGDVLQKQLLRRP